MREKGGFAITETDTIDDLTKQLEERKEAEKKLQYELENIVPVQDAAVFVVLKMSISICYRSKSRAQKSMMKPPIRSRIWTKAW